MEMGMEMGRGWRWTWGWDGDEMEMGTEGKKRTLFVHLKSKEVFQLTGICCLVSYCLVLMAYGRGGLEEVLFTPVLGSIGKHTFRDSQNFLLF